MSGIVFPVLGDYRISSVFGPRSSPGGIGSTNHKGIDIAATSGTPVVSTVGGTVIGAGVRGGYGNTVTIRDDSGNTHLYGHMQGYNVRPGQTVQAGSRIGAVGSTGNSTGPHLHYEIRDAAGKVINPQGLLSQGAEALKKAGKQLLGIDTADVANIILPGSGTLLEATGVVGDCNWICQLQNWIKESGFFQRLAIAVLAFIIIAAALFMMKSNLIGQVTTKAKGALT